MREWLVIEEQGERLSSDDKEVQREFITVSTAPVALLFPAALRYPFNTSFKLTKKPAAGGACSPPPPQSASAVRVFIGFSC